MPVTSPWGGESTAVWAAISKIERQPLVMLLQVCAPMNSRLLLPNAIREWWPSVMATPDFDTVNELRLMTSSRPPAALVPAT